VVEDAAADEFHAGEAVGEGELDEAGVGGVLEECEVFDSVE
jgi:hypothetical protein